MLIAPEEDEVPQPTLLSNVIQLKQIGPITLEISVIHPQAKALVIEWPLFGGMLHLGTGEGRNITRHINWPRDLVMNMDTVVIHSNLIREDYHQEAYRHAPLLAKFNTNMDADIAYINPTYLHYRPVCSKMHIETVQFEFFTETGKPIPLDNPCTYISLTLHYKRKEEWMCQREISFQST